MKIVHICLGGTYGDGHSYQENLLSKYHKQFGLDVEIICSLASYDNEGNPIFLETPSTYYNEYGIKVTRIAYKKPTRIYKKIKRFDGLSNLLQSSKPDIFFIHNCQFMDVDIVSDYARKNNVTIYVDNHADFLNSGKNILSKYILHKMIWRHCAKVIEPFTKKFYGVLPARVEYLEKVLKLPKSKCELLVMGADDEIANIAMEETSIKMTRRKYGISDTELLIITGGKLNKNRPEVLNLVKAIKECGISKIKLIVFGSISDEYKNPFFDLIDSRKTIYAGWINLEQTYRIMAAADLMIFPGLHSVLWEQAVALGVPCVFRDLAGFHHVDIGGNALFVKDVTVEGIKKILIDYCKYPEKLDGMKKIAKERGMQVFAYYEIARRAIEMEN